MDVYQTRLDRLRDLLDEVPSRQKVDLSRRIKKSPAQISQWLSGYRQIGERAAREIELAARKPAGWLDSVDALDGNPSTKTDAPSRGMAQELSHFALTVAPTFTWEQLMSQPVELPPEFHVLLVDDAMAPRAPKGAKVKFATSRIPNPGDAVLCTAADGHVYFREYRVHHDGAWIAHAPNPAYPSLHSIEHGLRIVAVFCGIDIGWSALSR